MKMFNWRGRKVVKEKRSLGLKRKEKYSAAVFVSGELLWEKMEAGKCFD